MSVVSSADFTLKASDGSLGQVKPLTDADIALINTALQDLANLEKTFQSPFPVGTILPFTTGSVPSGFLICNGAAVSRVDYACLFSAIGVLFGAGDGTTTFNLPDCRDRVLQAASMSSSRPSGTYIPAGAPDFSGDFSMAFGQLAFGDGACSTGATNTSFYPACENVSESELSPNRNNYIEFSAAASNAVYGASTTVQPPAGIVSYIIKV